jgi:hypothetical protein
MAHSKAQTPTRICAFSFFSTPSSQFPNRLVIFFSPTQLKYLLTSLYYVTEGGKERLLVQFEKLTKWLWSFRYIMPLASYTNLRTFLVIFSPHKVLKLIDIPPMNVEKDADHEELLWILWNWEGNLPHIKELQDVWVKIRVIPRWPLGSGCAN